MLYTRRKLHRAEARRSFLLTAQPSWEPGVRVLAEKGLKILFIYLYFLHKKLLAHCYSAAIRADQRSYALSAVWGSHNRLATAKVPILGGNSFTLFLLCQSHFSSTELSSQTPQPCKMPTESEIQHQMTPSKIPGMCQTSPVSLRWLTRRALGTESSPIQLLYFFPLTYSSPVLFPAVFQNVRR